MTTNESYAITSEELKQVRAASDTIRRTPTVTGDDAADIIDKAIAAIVEEGERADRAEAKLAEYKRGRIEPSPFTLNPVCGTMGYICMLAEYNGELDEWVLHDDGCHYGWIEASLVEPGAPS